MTQYKQLTGAMTALITPFKNGKLDEVTYEKLIKRQIAQNIDCVVPVGTTGESATLSMNDHTIEISIPGTRLKRDTKKQIKIKQEKFRRRASIEPIIGHIKSDHRMARNYLKGF